MNRSIYSHSSKIIFVITVLVYAGCKNVDPNIKMIYKGNNIWICKAYENKKMFSECEATRENGKLIVDGYFKTFYDNGNVEALVFFKKGICDSTRNKYYYLESGKLERIVHDSTSIKVEGYAPVHSWKSDIVFANTLALKTTRNTRTFIVFRVFKKVKGQLDITISNAKGESLFDTTYKYDTPPQTDNESDHGFIIQKTLPDTGRYVYLVRYTLTDSISGINFY